MTRQTLDRQLWREVFPGVPDDAVVLPRHAAYRWNFPPAGLHGSDAPNMWGHIRTVAQAMVTSTAMRSKDDQVERRAGNVVRRAVRWWASLGDITALKLNQRLYSHRDGWRDYFDLPEFFACYLLCLIWLTLPDARRSSDEVRRLGRRHVREALKTFRKARPAGDPPAPPVPS